MSPAFIQVPWTTPVFLNAWLATAGDVRAVLVQFIIFALEFFYTFHLSKLMTKLLNKKWKVKIMKQILLVCNAGMSTSMLVKNATKCD